MKNDIHPKMNPVCFIDAPTGNRLLTVAALSSKERETIDGVEHHVVHLSTSGASHPAFTGQKQILDTAGRIDKFKKRYAKPA
ncbi:MAG: 50S ribosomal protein L31 [Verrucomicrobia bacterium]|nr:50S ribosomal protein L31 [Kiritimatiellia bacterium]MCB1100936.1 50S ribosomal protein L31 [Kiritimatiellia bacterium]MCP5489254.1 50S ribosomal protein L31 [Verrucomicrobiota bacterium]